MAASADSSTPCASNDCELMYAPNAVAAATVGRHTGADELRLTQELEQILELVVEVTDPRADLRRRRIPARARRRSRGFAPDRSATRWRRPVCPARSSKSAFCSWKTLGALMPLPMLKLTLVSPTRLGGRVAQIHRRREARHGFGPEHLVVLDAHAAAEIGAAHDRRASFDERAAVVRVPRWDRHRGRRSPFPCPSARRPRSPVAGVAWNVVWPESAPRVVRLSKVDGIVAAEVENRAAGDASRRSLPSA